jgi:GT2 family glycosyltransferase
VLRASAGEMSMLSYSAVLVTKDRRARAERMLAQMIGQTRRPARMVVIDASTPPLALDDGYGTAAREAGIDLVVLHSAPGIPAQRNLGVDLVETPVTLILDDDVIVPPEYMERLLARWEARGRAELGGAVGAIHQGPHDPPRFGRAERLVRRLFFLSDIARDAPGTTLRRSGKFREVPVPAEDVLVPVFTNAAVAFRTDLLRRLRFDEQFSGYVYGEDLDLSVRLARVAPILHTPTTWYIHDWAPEGRANDEMWYRRSRQEAYFRLRLIDRSPPTLTAFGLSIAAETAFAALESVRRRRVSPLRRYLSGLRDTIRALRAEHIRDPGASDHDGHDAAERAAD